MANKTDYIELKSIKDAFEIIGENGNSRLFTVYAIVKKDLRNWKKI